MKAKDHIKYLQKWHDPEEEIAVTVWCAGDVRDRAEEMEIDLSDSEVSEVLALMDNKHDCNIGNTLEAVDVWIDHVRNG